MRTTLLSTSHLLHLQHVGGRERPGSLFCLFKLHKVKLAEILLASKKPQKIHFLLNTSESQWECLRLPRHRNLSFY